MRVVILVRLTCKAVLVAGAVLMASFSAHADSKQLIVAEPTHGVGYLPLYVSIDEGYFKQLGLDVKFTTMEGGSAHTNAVLSGQAFAYIGGPEHNAFANLGGKELHARVPCPLPPPPPPSAFLLPRAATHLHPSTSTLVNVVDRGNVYFVAATGKGPKDSNLAAYAKGGQRWIVRPDPLMVFLAGTPADNSESGALHHLFFSHAGGSDPLPH